MAGCKVLKSARVFLLSFADSGQAEVQRCTNCTQFRHNPTTWNYLCRITKTRWLKVRCQWLLMIALDMQMLHALALKIGMT
jgi:hypothetical protein